MCTRFLISICYDVIVSPSGLLIILFSGRRQELRGGGLSQFFRYHRCQKSPKIRFSPSDGELACSSEGVMAPNKPLTRPVFQRWQNCTGGITWYKI